MYCVKCLENNEKEEKTKVLESRKYGDTVYRQRKCLSCGEVFYTEEKEVIENTGLKYIWNNIQRERRRRDVKQKENSL